MEITLHRLDRFRGIIVSRKPSFSWGNQRCRKEKEQEKYMSTCLYKFEDIPTHGDKISSKQEGMTRFYFENVDGLPVNSKDKVFKKDKLDKIISQLEVDVLLCAETRRQ